MTTPCVVGHRGAMAYEPENTLRSFARAIGYGCCRIELDVHGSKDGHLVLLHDDTLDRTTNGSGYVWDYTLEELKRLDAGEGEKIPTLQEVLDLIRGKIRLLLEIKQEGIEADVISLIDENELEDEIVISSFFESVLLKVTELNPSIGTFPLFRVWDALPDIADAAKRLSMQTIGANWRTGTAEVVQEAHRLGLLVHTSIPVRLDLQQTEVAVQRVCDLGVDEILSDRPDFIIRILAGGRV